MDAFPFATALLSADGSLHHANARWAAEFPLCQQLADLLHPVDALRLRNATRLHARLQLPVRVRGNGSWQTALALLSPQPNACALSLLIEPHEAGADHAAAEQAELLGGVVHSFNNYLSAMMGFSELALLDVDATHPAYGQLQTVLDSGQQAVQFTRELLASAGRAVLSVKTFSLPQWLRSQLERHGIPLSAQDIDCAIGTDPDWLAHGLDLAVNFLREGEPSVITAEFSVCSLHGQAAAALALAAGRYGVLMLRDRGRGLDSKHLLPLFKPYYSSKAVRGRKGLGMAPLKGVARQIGGNVLALAEPGEGSAIVLLLPLMKEGAELDVAAAAGTRTAWFLTELPWLAELAQAQLAEAGIAVAAVNQAEAQNLQTDELRPDFLLSCRFKDEGAAATLRQHLNVPVVIWTPFADHRAQTASGISLVKFSPDGEHLRTGVSALLKSLKS
ncbi:HAMP domain-containing histidine kinase [Permianibacter sp. IMCC34836]|uniref:sensor histidine kinase n=1 Tax=Permianibacter fluminis TaxID=2738515 RepID=UPI00155461F2|nr:HAMP domain-containing sensor histidine kinase [Permianibacter fluminis]NQD37751.1 HAMP domain-containing histidine kinase [Permianibacter fluminis]